MKIKEVEEALGISRETVRYYIKEGLVAPEQKENKYREYADSDVEILKEVLVLRRLGISINDIRDVLNGRADLRDVLENNMRSLDRKQKDITEAIEKCAEMLREYPEMFDAGRYFKKY